MRTKLMQGTAPRANDQQVTALMDAEANAHDGGQAMVVGVRNEAGQLYRAIEATGMGQFIGMTSGLQALGLRDELQHTMGMREGCDAIFAG